MLAADTQTDKHTDKQTYTRHNSSPTIAAELQFNSYIHVPWQYFRFVKFRLQNANSEATFILHTGGRRLLNAFQNPYVQLNACV